VDKPVELIALICPRCSTPVPAEPEEVAWVCRQCGEGWTLEEERGLAPLRVQYAAGIAPDAAGKPFWMVEGQVSLQRQAYGSGRQQAGEAELFWSLPRQFYIPAFTCSLEELLDLGTRLLLQPPSQQPGTAAKFEPVTLAPEDIQATAEFIVMAIEAGRKDKLKEVDFNLRLSSPVLWVLP
jgi:hypothetical protein